MSAKPTTFTGRVWLLVDNDNQLIDDIDTDMIYHNAHLAVTDIDEMGQYAFGNLDGYKHFAAEAKPGDIVLAGANFGAGSSRAQAVDCFKSLGVSCLVAKSYGAIYKRNAINAGFPILTAPDLDAVLDALEQHDEVAVDMVAGAITKDGATVATLDPVSAVQLDIYHAGDLFTYAKTLE